MRTTQEGELAATILKAIRGIRYGSLEIIIHDSKIVRIEKHEKIRLDSDVNTDQSSGG
jgi:hypothetical protein